MSQIINKAVYSMQPPKDHGVWWLNAKTNCLNQFIDGC